MSYAIIFVLACLIGFAVGGIFAILTTSTTIVKVVHDTGINPDELIAWLENYVHNYEWLSPLTTGEIIRRIKEMKEEIDEGYDVE